MHGHEQALELGAHSQRALGHFGGNVGSGFSQPARDGQQHPQPGRFQSIPHPASRQLPGAPLWPKQTPEAPPFDDDPFLGWGPRSGLLEARKDQRRGGGTGRQRHLGAGPGWGRRAEVGGQEKPFQVEGDTGRGEVGHTPKAPPSLPPITEPLLVLGPLPHFVRL